MIGLLLIALPVVMIGLLSRSRGNARRQASIVTVTALVAFAIIVGYTVAFGLEAGDTWLGIALVSLGPYATAGATLRARAVKDRPLLMFAFVPIALLLGFLVLVVVAVNVGLIGPPF